MSFIYRIRPQIFANCSLIGAIRKGTTMSFNTLTWGVKASFRNYVEGAGGSIIASDGATRTEDGAFTFKAAPDGDLVIAPDGSATGSARFLGKIMFEAHGGMLSSTLTDLCLEVTDEGLVLTVLDAPMNQDRCAIATLSPRRSQSTVCTR